LAQSIWNEAVPVELKLHDQDKIVGIDVVAAEPEVVLDVGDLGVGEDGCVKLGGFFCVAVEPEAGGEFELGERGHGGDGMDLNDVKWRSWFERAVLSTQSELDRRDPKELIFSFILESLGINSDIGTSFSSSVKHQNLVVLRQQCTLCRQTDLANQ
jgi:hypothetical protein